MEKSQGVSRAVSEDGEVSTDDTALSPRRRENGCGQPALGSHCEQAARQQGQATERGGHLPSSPERGPRGCRQTGPVAGAARGGSVDRERAGTHQGSLSRGHRARNKEKNTAEPPVMACLCNLFFNQEVTMGLADFCKETFQVTFSSSKFE